MEDVKLQKKIKAFLDVEHGDGDGYGCGSGYCSGEGYGIGMIDGKSVHRIDGVQTVLTAVRGNVAKGFILLGDMTLQPCFVVKGNRMFAHGETLRDAMQELTDKMFEDMPEEERIAEFIKAYPELDKPYPNAELFGWHHRLTGSCEMGRKAFMRDNDLSMDGSCTIADFIQLTKNAYNGSVIRNLEMAYQK